MGFPNDANVIEYIISLVLSVLCKIAVPLFFMISGCLLLQKQEDLKTIIKKRIVKYAVVIMVASFVVYLFSTVIYNHNSFSVREYVKVVYRGTDYGTYWFLYAYMGVLLFLPLLQKINTIVDKQMVGYLILLRLVFIGILPILIFVALGYHMSNLMSSYIISQPLFYFIIGWYFGTCDNPWNNAKNRLILIILSVVSIVISCLMTWYEYIVSGEYTENYFEGLLPIVVITIFCFFRAKDISAKSTRISEICNFLGDKVFGIYLLEPIIKEYCYSIYMYLVKNIGTPLIGSLLWCLFAFSIGTIMVWLIKLIPPVRKYI
jgi:surface polysaccharide O-acyltransferase-like enzyme